MEPGEFFHRIGVGLHAFDVDGTTCLAASYLEEDGYGYRYRYAVLTCKSTASPGSAPICVAYTWMSPPAVRCQSDAPGSAFSRTMGFEGGATAGDAGVDAPQSSATPAAAAKSLTTTYRPLYSANRTRGSDGSEPDAHSVPPANATSVVFPRLPRRI